MVAKTQPSFSGGVISSALYGRTDYSKYSTALRQAVNMMIRPEGGVLNRAGMRVIGNVPVDDEKARLIPFQFNTDQTYALLYQAGRTFIVTNGGYIVDTVDAIFGVSQTNPCVVTSPGHSLNNGDYVYIDSVEGMTQLNGGIFLVANVTPGTFELSGVDSSGFDAYTSGGNVYKLYEFSNSYTEDQLFDIKFTQDADTLITCHPAVETKEVTRAGNTAWSETSITWGTQVPTPTGGVGVPSSTGQYSFDYAVVAVDSDTFEKSLPHEFTALGSKLPLNDTTFITVDWNDVPNAGWYEIYRGKSADYAYLTTVNNSLFIDDGIYYPNQYLTPPYDAGNFFDSVNNRPSCATYFQQRLYLAGTYNFPQTVYGTQVGRFKNMNKHFPIQDDDAISFTLNANQVNQIRHMIPLDSLIVLTSGGEWVIDGGGFGQPITATSVSAKKRGSEGCSQVPPIVIEDDVLFIQNKGSDIRSLSYKEESNGYIGETISILASDYFENHRIVDWCYSRKPHSVVWAVRDDGKLLSLVYLKQHEVYGWTEHETEGEVESICSIAEGSEDVVYMVVKRSINGTITKFVERLNTRIFEDVRDSFFSDCGVTLDAPFFITSATQTNPVVVTTFGPHHFEDGDFVDIVDVVGMSELNNNRYVVANKTPTTIELTSVENGSNIDGTSFGAYLSGGEVRKCVTVLTSLYYLEGEEISILVDGQTHPKRIVTNGKVTLDYPGSRIHAGLPFESYIETLDVHFNDETHNRKKNIGHVVLHFKDTIGAYVGPDMSNTLPLKWRVDENYNQADKFFTGKKEIDILPSWSLGGRFFIRQPNPLPICVLSVTPEVKLSG